MNLTRRTFIALLLLLLIPWLAFGAAPTETYVDPSIAADSGTGTIGDPYGDLQYALDTMTRDSTNGDRINVKAGTAESLSANLNLTTYGTPTANAPLIIQGYTAAANDGGVGVVDGAGSYGVFNASEDYINLRDMEFRNSGGTTLVNLDNYCVVIDCVLHNSTSYLLHADANLVLIRCHLYDGSSGGALVSDGYVAFCYFENSTKDFTATLTVGSGSKVDRCIFNIDGSSNGIVLAGSRSQVTNNSILSSSGTGIGIALDIATRDNLCLTNNVIEGFSGAGGDGFSFASNTALNTLLAGNAYYNNTSNETNKPTGRWLIDTDNESLTRSAFSKSGSNTFANRHTYYAPLDVGNIYNGAWPSGINTDKGAVQHSDISQTGHLVVEVATWSQPSDPTERTLDLDNYTWLGPITAGAGGTTIIIVD